MPVKAGRRCWTTAAHRRRRRISVGGPDDPAAPVVARERLDAAWLQVAVEATQALIFEHVVREQLDRRRRLIDAAR